MAKPSADLADHRRGLPYRGLRGAATCARPESGSPPRRPTPWQPPSAAGWQPAVIALHLPFPPALSPARGASRNPPGPRAEVPAQLAAAEALARRGRMQHEMQHWREAAVLYRQALDPPGHRCGPRGAGGPAQPAGPRRETSLGRFDDALNSTERLPRPVSPPRRPPRRGDGRSTTSPTSTCGWAATSLLSKPMTRPWRSGTRGSARAASASGRSTTRACSSCARSRSSTRRSAAGARRCVSPPRRAHATATAAALAGLGSVASRLGRRAEAVEDLRQAVALRRRAGDRAGLATDLLGLGTADLKLDLLAAAADSYLQARSLFQQLGDRHGEGMVALGLGRYHLARGDLARSFASNQEAMAILQLDTHDRQCRLRRRRLCSGARGPEPPSAVSARARALPRHRRRRRRGDARRELEPGPAPLFLRGAPILWDLYIDVLMRLDAQRPGAGFAAAALGASERRRARALLDEVAAGTPGSRRPPAAEERATEERLSGADEQRLILLSRGAPIAALAPLDAAVRSLLVRLDHQRAQDSRTAQPAAAAGLPAPLTARDVEALVGDDTVLLEYSLGEPLQRPGRSPPPPAVATAWPARARRIEAAVAALTRSFDPCRPAGTEAAWRQAATALSALVLACRPPPAAPPASSSSVAEGALLYVPFAALPEPAAAAPEAPQLIDGHDVVAEPSASVLGALRRRERPPAGPPGSVAVLADPVFPRRRSSPRCRGAPAGEMGSRRSSGNRAGGARERRQRHRRHAERSSRLAGLPLLSGGNARRGGGHPGGEPVRRHRRARLLGQPPDGRRRRAARLPLPALRHSWTDRHQPPRSFGPRAVA